MTTPALSKISYNFQVTKTKSQSTHLFILFYLFKYSEENSDKVVEVWLPLVVASIEATILLRRLVENRDILNIDDKLIFIKIESRVQTRTGLVLFKTEVLCTKSEL